MGQGSKDREEENNPRPRRPPQAMGIPQEAGQLPNWACLGKGTHHYYWTGVSHLALGL